VCEKAPHPAYYDSFHFRHTIRVVFLGAGRWIRKKRQAYTHEEPQIREEQVGVITNHCAG